MHRSSSQRLGLSAMSTIFLFTLFIQDAIASSSIGRDTDDECFTSDRDSSHLNIDAPLCQIPGQTDFYGFGVRVGIYLTWVSSWLANNFAAGEMPGALDTNSIFLLAVALTVAVLSFLETIWIIDSIVLLQLSFGFVLGSTTIWGRRTRYYKQGHFGGWGTHCRLALCLAVCAYSLWFWTTAIVDPDPDCFLRDPCGGLRTFFFASLSAMGGIRIFYAVFSAVGCFYYGVMMIVAMVAFVQHIISLDKSWIPIEHQGLSGPDMQGSKRLYLALTSFSLFSIVFTMLVVEFTLNLNHVEGVLADAGIANASQLLPLLIGIFSTVRICWVIYHDKVVERRKRRAEGTEQVELGAMHTSSEPRTVSGTDMQPQEGQEHPQEGQQKWWYHLLSMWLPWLSCYKWWRDHSGAGVSSSTTTATDDVARRGSYSTLKTSLMSVEGYGDVTA